MSELKQQLDKEVRRTEIETINVKELYKIHHNKSTEKAARFIVSLKNQYVCFCPQEKSTTNLGT